MYGTYFMYSVKMLIGPWTFLIHFYYKEQTPNEIEPEIKELQILAYYELFCFLGVVFIKIFFFKGSDAESS